MIQLTIRGFDQDLERKLRELAEAEGISLNKAALRLLRRGAGLDVARQTNVIGTAMDDLAGTWSAGDEREFLEAIAPFESVDDEFWK